MITREQLLAIASTDRKTETVEVPQWLDADGKPVVLHIRELSARARAQLRSLWLKMVGPDKSITGQPADADVLTFMLGVVDENGAQLFTEADLPWLRERNGLAIQHVAGAINRLSGILTEAVDDAEKK